MSFCKTYIIIILSTTFLFTIHKEGISQDCKALMESTEALAFNNNFKECLIGCQSILDCYSNNSIKKDTFFSYFSYLKGACHYYLGDYENSIIAVDTALNVEKRVIGDLHDTYALALTLKATVLFKQKLYPDAEQCYLENNMIRKRIFGEKHPRTILGYVNMIPFYQSWSNWKTVTTLIDSIDTWMPYETEANKKVYSSFLIKKGQILRDFGKYSEAEHTFLTALDKKEKQEGKTIQYYSIMQELAVIYTSIHNYELSEYYSTEASKFFLENFGKKSQQYNVVKQSLGVTKIGKGDYEGALKIFLDLEGAYDKTHITSNTIDIYVKQGQYRIADSIAIETLSQIDEKNKYYSRLLRKRGTIAYNLDKIDLADSIFMLEYSYFKKYGEHLSKDTYLKLLSNLCITKAIKGDHNQSIAYMHEMQNIIKKYVENIIPNLHGYNQYKLHESILESKSQMDYACILIGKKEANMLLIENSIRYKNLLLKQNINYDKSDSTVIKLMGFRQKLASLFTSNESSTETKKCELEIEILTNKILSNNPTQLIQNISSLQEIKNNLGKEDILIDIIKIQTRKNKYEHEIQYAFVIVQNDTIEPKIVVLKNGNLLERVYYDQYRDFVTDTTETEMSSASYNRFWAQLEPYIGTRKNVYYVPDGVFQKINPEALFHPDGYFLMDKHQFIRLQNTKEIIAKEITQSFFPKTALLVGNPDFESLSTDSSTSMQFQFRSSPQKRLTYVPLSKIPSTQKEISKIGLILSDKKYEIRSLLKEYATEKAVKESGSPSILHIATHANAFDENVNVKTTTFSTNLSMLLSQIYLAGANATLSNNQVNSTLLEDGILSAYEVQDMNLQNTRLVVLSACETGIGEVHTGDGVWGLHRAFRYAGAKQVLMSLWKVPSKVTTELMILFYENWLTKGMDKHSALRAAQLKIKEQYPQPVYWGAWVLVGG